MDDCTRVPLEVNCFLGNQISKPYGVMWCFYMKRERRERERERERERGGERVQTFSFLSWVRRAPENAGNTSVRTYVYTWAMNIVFIYGI